MYTPKINQINDEEEAINFMRTYSFATIVTVANGLPSATHLPFVVEMRDKQILLLSHFAKANHQAIDIFDCKPLVIFTEPHAYISPVHYEKKESVPTWNYMAVHAYGQAKQVDNTEEVLAKMINFYEPAYMEKWTALTEVYKGKMMQGIVAFEIVVDELQAKFKLSQNRSQQEQQNIVAAFSKSADPNEVKIAEYMNRVNNNI